MRSGNDFVKTIDKLLIDRNCTRKGLAKFLDINQTTISAWKTRNIIPSVEILAKITQFFDVSLDFLILNEVRVKDIAIPQNELELFLELRKTVLKNKE